MVLRYRGNKKAKHSESLDSPIPSEPPKNERNKGTNEEETAEVEMTFCAPSEEVRCEMNLYACRCDWENISLDETTQKCHHANAFARGTESFSKTNACMLTQTVDKWITALKPAVLKSTHHFHSGALLNKARSKVSGNRRRYPCIFILSIWLHLCLCPSYHCLFWASMRDYTFDDVCTFTRMHAGSQVRACVHDTMDYVCLLALFLIASSRFFVRPHIYVNNAGISKMGSTWTLPTSRADLLPWLFQLRIKSVWCEPYNITSIFIHVSLFLQCSALANS